LTQNSCELCDAAPITERYHEDDVCWIAECESCGVPMVVWRNHDPTPPTEVKAVLHARLLEVVARHFTYEPWIDDHMRNIPDHYHAHARPKGGFFGFNVKRRDP
jgi:hypothetical protein